MENFTSQTPKIGVSSDNRIVSFGFSYTHNKSSKKGKVFNKNFPYKVKVFDFHLKWKTSLRKLQKSEFQFIAGLFPLGFPYPQQKFEEGKSVINNSPYKVKVIYFHDKRKTSLSQTPKLGVAIHTGLNHPVRTEAFQFKISIRKTL